MCGQACPNYPKEQVCYFLKIEVSDEVEFLHVDRHESFLEIDTIIFDGDLEAFPKFPKY